MSDATSRLAPALADRYRLERELGQGGMATVYLAHDLKHDRDVALKVLRPELAAVLGAERFLREIRLTAQLQHPHIITLIDSGEAAGTLYYVLPYIEGESLRQRLIREGQMPLDEVLGITRAVAGALQYAHDQGVIHRDIKPENILLSRGEPVVADFGIALAAASAGRERLTETGLSLGTPAYMSPEQASAEQRLDGRSDQYSLACVVYEMLAGEPPYTGSTAQAIVAKRLSEPVPKVTTLRQVPARVEAAITRALAKRPADRFGTVAEFAAALERPQGPPRRFLTRRLAALLGGLAVLGGIALAAWLFRPDPPPRAMVTRQLTFNGASSLPALSPDAKWGAYWTGDSLMAIELASGQAVLAARAKPCCDEPKWNRDGSAILYGAEDSEGNWLYSAPRLGGTTTRIAHVGEASFDLSPDDREVVSSPAMQDSIYVTDVATGQVVRRWSVTPTSYTAWRTPVSPDGRWIAFGGEREGIPWLGVVSSDGSMIRRLVDWVDRGTLQWSPRGDAIYFFQRVPGGADLMKVHIDPKTGERIGERTRVMSHAPFTEFAVGVDGRTLLYEKDSPTSQVWTMEMDNRSGVASVRSRQLTSGTATYGNPVISPNGKQVAYAKDEGTQRNIYVVPFEGGAARLIGPTRSDYLMPRWSPDGRFLAFASADSSAGGIMIADVTGGRPQHHGTSHLCLYYATLAWSPDGKRLLYPSDDPRKFVMLDVETDTETILGPPTPGGWLRGPVFSPDGRALVIASGDHDFRLTLWHVELQAGAWTRVEGAQGAGFPILWSQDGWIYSAGNQQIRRLRPQGGTWSVYATLPKVCSLGTSLPSMDDSARRLVCTVVESKPDIWVATDFDPEVR